MRGACEMSAHARARVCVCASSVFVARGVAPSDSSPMRLANISPAPRVVAAEVTARKQRLLDEVLRWLARFVESQTVLRRG